MEPQQLRSWIASQIEDHVPSSGERLPSAVRLLDAVAALRGVPGKSQAFGLALPDAGVVDAASLAARGIELLSLWAKVLPADDVDELALLAQCYGIPFDAQPRPLHAPTTHALAIWTSVELTDRESDEPITDPEILRDYQGVLPADDIDLIDLPSLRDATGGDTTAVSNYPVYGWATSAMVALMFDEATATLSAVFAFELTREPSAEELSRLLDVVRDELPYTGWGLNLYWDYPNNRESIRIHLPFEIQRHALSAV